jgi:hypothetical protein
MDEIRESRKARILAMIEPCFEGIRFAQIHERGFRHLSAVELRGILRELVEEGHIRELPQSPQERRRGHVVVEYVPVPKEHG